MNYIGVIEDPRPESEKAKDYKAEYLFSGGSKWKEKGQDWVKEYKRRYQDGSSQCMGYSGAKHLGINEMKENGSFVDLSPTFIYRLRSNDGPGMFMQNLLDILVKHGSPKDTWFPCDNLNDTDILKAPVPTDAVKAEALKYKGKSYFQFTAMVPDSIAQAIDTVGSAIILIRCNNKEWTQKPFIDPKVTQADWDINHAVLCTDYGLIDGKKYIKVEDSWGKYPEKWISADFIYSRMFGGGYVIDEKQLPKPKTKFLVDIERGNPVYRGMVEDLQKILIYEGLMTFKDAATGWGFFGPKTLAAVIKFQEKYRDEILKPVGLTKGTGYVGVSTRNFINKKYG
jgi:hypothetical protein